MSAGLFALYRKLSEHSIRESPTTAPKCTARRLLILRALSARLKYQDNILSSWSVHPALLLTQKQTEPKQQDCIQNRMYSGKHSLIIFPAPSDQCRTGARSIYPPATGSCAERN